jgi:ABC-type oligopeptide transport system substrate-binding subunit
MEWKAYLNALETNPPDIFRINWTADYPDPDSFMQLFMINNPINYPGFINADYDRIVEKAARLSMDSPERRRLYRRAEEILLKENAVVAPIFTNTQTIIHRNNIDNLDINAMDMLFLDKITKHE